MRAAGEGGRGRGLEWLAWDWGGHSARGGVGEGCVHLGCKLEMLAGGCLTRGAATSKRGGAIRGEIGRLLGLGSLGVGSGGPPL